MPHARLIALATAANAAVTFDAYFVTLALPSLPWSVSSASWVLNAHAIVFGALLVPAGRFADAIGLRRSYIFGFAALAAGSAASALAPNLLALVAARVAEGAGAALLIPSALGLIVRGVEESARPRALAIWMAGSAGTAALGPALAGALLSVSWRLGFVVVLPVALAAAIGARCSVCPRTGRNGAHADVLGSLLLVATLAALTGALLRGSVELGALSVAAGAAFVARSAHHASPVLELSLLRSRGFAVALVANGLKYAAYSAWLLGCFLLFTRVWGYSAFTAGVAIAPGAVTAGTAAFAGTRLLRAFEPARLAAAGTLAVALGVAWWLPSAGPDGGYALVALPAVVLVGLGLGISAPALTAVATSSLPGARAATGSATLMMSRQVGSTIGVAVALALIGQTIDEESLGDVWAACAVTLVAAALACTALSARPAAARGTPQAA